MLGASQVGGRGGGREDRQVAIELRAVGVDDHAVGPLGQRQRKRRLAAGGRTGDEGEWRGSA